MNVIILPLFELLERADNREVPLHGQGDGHVHAGCEAGLEHEGGHVHDGDNHPT